MIMTAHEVGHVSAAQEITAEVFLFALDKKFDAIAETNWLREGFLAIYFHPVFPVEKVDHHVMLGARGIGELLSNYWHQILKWFDIAAPHFFRDVFEAELELLHHTQANTVTQ